MGVLGSGSHSCTPYLAPDADVPKGSGHSVPVPGPARLDADAVIRQHLHLIWGGAGVEISMAHRLRQSTTRHSFGGCFSQTAAFHLPNRGPADHFDLVDGLELRVDQCETKTLL